jgi:hypothetical protein
MPPSDSYCAAKIGSQRATGNCHCTPAITQGGAFVGRKSASGHPGPAWGYQPPLRSKSPRRTALSGLPFWEREDGNWNSSLAFQLLGVCRGQTCGRGRGCLAFQLLGVCYANSVLGMGVLTPHTQYTAPGGWTFRSSLWESGGWQLEPLIGLRVALSSLTRTLS